MATAKQVTVRVQAREGTKRIQLSPNATTRNLYENVREAFNYSSFAYELYKDKGKASRILSSNTKTLRVIGVGHGDLVYLSPVDGAVLEGMDLDSPEVAGPSGQGLGTLSSSASMGALAISRQEDEVDVLLKTRDGLIQRPRDPKMCRHADKGQCIFCAPLEPYDETYLRAQNIKHLSFHSYLKKLTGGIDKGKFVALEDLNVTIKEGCQGHPPWPRGICSKCQPSAVTLNRQSYRHVDNVMFENPQIVEKFLSYWRASGHQRIGLLYGNYEEHTDVPLGIRARVSAIYEPPQESTRDKVRLILPDEKGALVAEIGGALGLQCLGWIFTDLIPEDTSLGTVRHLRGIHSYFLSAQECITAAYFQNLHPNPCKVAQSGSFGSKFATVLVTGDEKHQVHMVSYQVSNQCMSLVREKCLVPTKDAPEFGYIIESSEKQYVPDVFFKQKDEYGNEVTRLGRPLPVEYLLVDVTVSTPIQPQSMFTLKETITPFPVENRFIDGQIQDFTALAGYLGQFTKKDPFLRIASDFHFLLFLASMDIVPIRDYMGPLLESIRDRKASVAEDWAKSDFWATVEQLILASSMESSSGSSGGPAGRPAISPQSAWTCIHCTFINGGNKPNCDVCSLPR